MGKGDSPRPVDATKYRENWDRIFARRPSCGTCDGLEGWEDYVERDGLTEEVWVWCPECHSRDALDELTQLSQEMGEYAARPRICTCHWWSRRNVVTGERIAEDDTPSPYCPVHGDTSAYQAIDEHGHQDLA